LNPFADAKLLPIATYVSKNHYFTGQHKDCQCDPRYRLAFTASLGVSLFQREEERLEKRLMATISRVHYHRRSTARQVPQHAKRHRLFSPLTEVECEGKQTMA
jgi:hypothetical protein